MKGTVCTLEKRINTLAYKATNIVFKIIDNILWSNNYSQDIITKEGFENLSHPILTFG